MGHLPCHEVAGSGHNAHAAVLIVETGLVCMPPIALGRGHDRGHDSVSYLTRLTALDEASSQRSICENSRSDAGRSPGVEVWVHCDRGPKECLPRASRRLDCFKLTRQYAAASRTDQKFPVRVPLMQPKGCRIFLKNDVWLASKSLVVRLRGWM